jgi:tetratricopeptide (TPR) repeat protein
MEVAVSSRIPTTRLVSRLARLGVAAALAAAPLLSGGCSGMFVKAEDPKQAGLRLYQEKNYAEAAGAFRNAIRQDPRDYKSHYYLAVSCDADGRYQEAIEEYRSTLDIMNVTYEGKEDAAFRVKTLDGLAMTVGNPKADPHDIQLNQFERQAKASQKPEDFFLLAKIYRYRGDADMALENYQHAVLLDNKNFPALKEYGLYLQQIGQSQRAASTLSQAYRVNDKDEQVVTALRQLGVIPGPSLKEQSQLAQPVIPKGPIPPLDVTKIKNSIGLGPKNSDTPTIAPAPQPPESPTPASSLQAPRD